MKNNFSEFGETPMLDNAEPTSEDIAWLAGIFDGEGCIMMATSPKRKAPLLGFHITNSNIALLSKCQMILQTLLDKPISIKPKKSTNDKFGFNTNLRCFTIDFRGHNDIFKVLNKLMPHLTSKKPKAILVYEYLKHRIPEQKIMKNRLSSESTEFANLIKANWRGVTTEREALDILKMKPQSELYGNI